jgi:hypothetical protein
MTATMNITNVDSTLEGWLQDNVVCATVVTMPDDRLHNMGRVWEMETFGRSCDTDDNDRWEGRAVDLITGDKRVFRFPSAGDVTAWLSANNVI